MSKIVSSEKSYGLARRDCRIVSYLSKIAKAEKKTGACSQFSEAYPIFYKDNKNSQKNGKIWINKVSVWY